MIEEVGSTVGAPTVAMTAGLTTLLGMKFLDLARRQRARPRRRRLALRRHHADRQRATPTSSSQLVVVGAIFGRDHRRSCARRAAALAAADHPDPRADAARDQRADAAADQRDRRLASDLGFHVDGFWTALWGSIVISIASMVLEAVFPRPDRADERDATSLPAPTGTPYRDRVRLPGQHLPLPHGRRDPVPAGRRRRAGRQGRGRPAVAPATGTSASRWTRGPPRSCWPRGTTPRRTGRSSSTPSWLEQDLVLAMDAKNLADITGGAGVSDRVRMFRSFDPLVPTDGPGRPRRARTPSTAATRASPR